MVGPTKGPSGIQKGQIPEHKAPADVKEAVELQLPTESGVGQEADLVENTKKILSDDKYLKTEILKSCGKAVLQGKGSITNIFSKDIPGGKNRQFEIFAIYAAALRRTQKGG